MQSKDEVRLQVGLEPKDSPPSENGHHSEPEYEIAQSIQDILDVPDLGEIAIPVHQWKKRVVIRGLSREEFLRCKAQATTADKLDEARFEKALLVQALVSPKLNANTVVQFYQKDVAAIGVIIKAIMKHLGADAEAIKSDEAGDAGPGDTL
jgi:hypothetical protein